MTATDTDTATDSRADAGTPANPATPAAEPAAPLRSVHTPNLPKLFDQLGISLLVTTYQAGKLVVVRSEGDHLNTHCRNS